jgi:hypothetical protein
MTKEDLIRAREENANVAFVEFIKHIRQDKNGLFCFFEGNDAPYYQVQIRRVYQGNYYPISCGNKAKVLKVYELINYHRIYDKYKKGFFVDSDFDLPIGNPAIYETPCYSIENFYTSSTVFSEILKNELSLTEVSENYENAMNLYEKLLNEFLEATTLFNAWYACLKDLRNQNETPTGVNLSDRLPRGFVTYNLLGVESNYTFQSIQNQFHSALVVTEETVNQKITVFRQINKNCVFRGKYLFRFMMDILEKLVEDSRNQQTVMTERKNFNVTQNQGISQFAQYAETPENLMEYLEQILN